ncbi:MAG: hypothetical protein H0U17_11215 [Actinobacteria bacterium]|nr:hypothetical protein [Actinomycetota bacterium]
MRPAGTRFLAASRSPHDHHVQRLDARTVAFHRFSNPGHILISCCAYHYITSAQVDVGRRDSSFTDLLHPGHRLQEGGPRVAGFSQRYIGPQVAEPSLLDRVRHPVGMVRLDKDCHAILGLVLDYSPSV